MEKDTKLNKVSRSDKRRHKKATPAYKKKKKHHKPFRFRHVGLIVLALLIGASAAFQSGVYYAQSRQKTQLPETPRAQQNSVVSVRSSLGFSFAYDNQVLATSATEVVDEKAADVGESELRANKPLASVVVRPRSGVAPPKDAAAQLEIKVNQDTQTAGSLFEPKSDEVFAVDLLTQTNDTLGGVPVVKRVFQHTPTFTSNKTKLYSVQWTGVVDDRAFSVHLQGLVGDSSTPLAFQTVFDTLSFASVELGDVLGLSTGASLFDAQKVSAQEESSRYIIDSISPAVVKIYHATCGTLVVFGEKLGGESCDLSTGSGFFISPEGYIASNGHVVTHDAEDVFVGILQSDANTLANFLRNVVNLTDEQIVSLSQNPALFATLIAEIFDLPDDAIRIENESHTYFVAIGEDPLPVQTIQDVYALRDKPETQGLVKASLVDTNYSSQDLYVIGSGDETGFSSSDVAILKINQDNTPHIRLFDQTVTQNMAITAIGFPGDAENLLTDNTKLSPSVTNGTISAIRDSAGGKYKLYQSDADASSGSSGGPALSSDGAAIGLVTYRFKNSTQQDAAKSYIRAIEDIKALAGVNSIGLGGTGPTQQYWENGLELYSTNRFSAAIQEFEKVEEAFPAHRLVSDYIANAERAIDDGRDVKEFPLIVLIGGIAALIGLVSGVVLAVRHHGHHRAYKVSREAEKLQLRPEQNPITNSTSAT